MDRTLDILERLVGFPTVSADSNLDLIDYVQNLLHMAGFAVTRIPSPCGKKAGLFARIGPGDGGICLSAHTDVVPVAGQDWSSPPFALTRRADRLVGRGTTDMKGFLASALALAEQAQHTPLSAPLTLSISYDEEVGCVGIRDMMSTLAPLLGRPRMVIVGEPTSMQVATGHKGKVALRVDCLGQSGHSALAPNFVNAIHVAASFVDEMRALQEELAKGPTDDAYDIPCSTVHVGRITGGKALNIVPDLAQIEMEFRHLANLPVQSIRAQIQQSADKVGKMFGNANAVRITEGPAYFGLDTSRDAPAVDRALSFAATDQVTKVAFGTEAGFFAELGLDTVVVGPGNMAADGHKPDEGLALSELQACDAMMTRVLLDLG
ncbi:acetylornithine deacetylase [Aliiroseovarius sediminilitoris]|uniref:Acetylornithine deacetylase n=1 Tax=Aliiroseovarius sediminilitoris TaxID=1173584 RepID=A0A1I0QIG2_9RHOB|nr:acetylornithine deacetylase [Aliiroseovarius sediminilitoris]SEW26680.1 acetylornithine deacetylase [Aliiroseovarius sediminilitoris]